MDLLHELVYAVELDRPKSFTSLVQEDSKLHQLYKLVASDEYLTDLQAAQSMYNADKSDKRYLMLKRNLIVKLSELVLLSDLGEMEYSSLKFIVEKQLIVAEKLLAINVFHNPERIARKLLKESNRLQLNDISLRILKVLRKIYTLKGDHKKLKKTIEEYDEVRQLVSAEEEVLSLMELFEARILYSCALHSIKAQELKEYFDSVNKTSLFIDFQLKKFKVYHAHHHNAGMDKAKALKKLESFINKHSLFETDANRLFLRIYQIRYALFENDLKAVEKLIGSAEKLSSYKSFNRFEVAGLRYVFEMRKRAFEEAREIIDGVIDTPQFDRLHEIDQAAWFMRALYWQLIQEMENTGLMLENIRPERWSMDKVAKMLAPLNRDKKGYNIHFIIVRFLKILRTGDRDLLSTECNNLAVYFQRYIKFIPEPRTRIFVKFLYKSIRRVTEGKEMSDLSIKYIDQIHTHRGYDPNEFFSYPDFIQTIESWVGQNLLPHSFLTKKD